MNQGKTSLIDEDREFQRYYSLYLKPYEKHFESLRQKSVGEKNRRIIAALAAWLAAIGAIGYLGSIGDGLPFVIFFVVLAGLGLGVWAWLPAQAHVDRLKEQILPRIVSFFGDLHYQSEPDYNPYQYGGSMLLPDFNETYCEDQIEGSYHGVPLKLAEVRLDYEKSKTSKGEHTTTRTTVFKGLMVAFELGQEYPGVTLIRSRGSDMKGRFHLDKSLDEVGAGSGFEVFATKGAPGVKLADDLFLERLAEISARFKARYFFTSFHANQLVMMIGHEGDYFEMSHRQKTSFAKDAERLREQLGRIFAIVDLLNLEGVPSESRKDSWSPQHPRFSKRPGINDETPSEIGGWGCFNVFVMFAATMSAYLWLLAPELYGGALLWWSAFGGLLLSLGLFLTIRGIFRRSIGAMIFGLILLAGAFLVLYSYVSSDTQELIRSWVQEF